MRSDLYYDPRLRARTLGSEIRGCCDTVSTLIGHLVAALEYQDSTRRDAAILSITAEIRGQRDRLQRIASDVCTVADYGEVA